MGKFAEVEEKKVKKETKPTPPVQETVQRDLSDVNGPEGGMLPGDVSQKIQSMRGSGQRLSDRQNQFYSQKFGRDMSDVHVHTDAASDTVSRSLNARAFTIGSDVFLSHPRLTPLPCAVNHLPAIATTELHSICFILFESA